MTTSRFIIIKRKNLLYSVSGTLFLTDVGTDAYLAVGKLKQTIRYKEAVDVLDEAKAKYKPSKTTAIGHSLGSAIVSYLPADKITTLDRGTTFFWKKCKK